jgi:hypothetical protein
VVPRALLLDVLIVTCILSVAVAIVYVFDVRV